MKKIRTLDVQDKDFSFRKTVQDLDKSFESKIVNGDVIACLTQMDKKHKFDVIIADPPYNIRKDFGNNKDYMVIKEYVDWSKKWIGLSLDLLASNGVIYIYGLPEILARIAVEYPIEKQRILVWHYTNKTTPSSNFWQRSYESILCLWKENKRPCLEIDQIREPYTKNYLKCTGKIRKETKSRFGNKTTLYEVNKHGALPRDVIKIPALAGGAGKIERHFICKNCNNNFYNSNELKYHIEHDILQHPTQKPIALTKKLIQSKVNGNNGRILIPFVGSGSECFTAKLLGVKFFGIEINPEYVEYAKKWLELI